MESPALSMTLAACESGTKLSLVKETAMRVVNIHTAKTHLSRLVNEVAAGEEIVIAKAGKPVARLLPFEPRRQPRTPGLMKGQIWISEDFDDPLPEEIMAAFRGERP
jgi:prevent-host-death family protein